MLSIAVEMSCFRCFYSRAHSLFLLRSFSPFPPTISVSPLRLRFRRFSSDSLSVNSISDSDTDKPSSSKPNENSTSGFSRGWNPSEVVMNKKKGKSKTSWVCESCGNSDGQWWGSCRACNKVGTMRRFSEGSTGSATGSAGLPEGTGLSWLLEQAAVHPLKLSSVIHGITQQQWRISLYVLLFQSKTLL